VTIEHRSAAGHYDQLPALANDLARRKVAVIVTMLGTMSALSAKAATKPAPPKSPRRPNEGLQGTSPSCRVRSPFRTRGPKAIDH
jgi:hypothetical protein